MEKIEKFKNENMNLKIKNFNLTNELQKANSEITELKQKYGNQNKITDKLIEENAKLKDEIDIWKKRCKLLKKNLFAPNKNKGIKKNKKKGEKNENNDSDETEEKNEDDKQEEIDGENIKEEIIKDGEEDEKEGDKEIGEEKEDERNEKVKEDEKDEKKDVKKSKAKENKKEKEIRKKGEVGKTELILDNE